MREMVGKAPKEYLQIFFKDKHIWEGSWIFHTVQVVFVLLL